MGAITLRPTVNTKGACYFMSISTGICLNHLHFTPLHLPQDVLDRVHCLACRNQNGLDVRYCNRRTFLDDTDDDRGDNDEKSTYNETDYSDNDPPPGHNAMSGATGFTANDIRNLRQNAGVHDNNTEDNEEYGRITYSE